jgi:hypothetical protein
VRKIYGLVLALAITGASLLAGCSYAGVAVTADGHAVVARNDNFLFGILRSVSVCQVTPTGLSNCGSGDAP